MDPFIVAEISKNWRDGRSVQPTPLLAQQFERVINVNAQRGYRLHSFQIARVWGPGALEMNETIIAVFERERVINVNVPEQAAVAQPGRAAHS